jgi:hypothetical protein
VTATPERARLWRRWTVATTLGETVGFAVPALVGGLAYALAVPDAATVPLAVVAGMTEGAILGCAQMRILRRELDGFAGRAWVGATAAAAALGWAVAMPLGVYGSSLPTAMLVAAAFIAATVLLGAVGAAQWLVLRRFVATAWLWVPANALAWLLGLAFPFAALSLVDEGDPAALVVMAGLAGGLAMAVVVAAATGLALVRLLRPPQRRSPVRSVARRLGGRTELVLFALGGGLVYLATALVLTLTLGEGLPLLGWIGFAVAATVVLAASTILALFLVWSSTRAGSEPPLLRPASTAAAHRVLVVADEGCSGAALCGPLAAGLDGGATEVLVVAPALVSGVRYLDSDVDPARKAAEARLAETVAALEEAGITARGEVGSESPLEAIADALARFAADEIVVATPPPDRTNWLEEHVTERARELYEQPVSHLVVDAAPLELGVR